MTTYFVQIRLLALFCGLLVLSSSAWGQDKRLNSPGIYIMPADVRVFSGTTIQFYSVFCHGDRLITPMGASVEWEARGGSISEMGKFKAGSTPGKYMIYASFGKRRISTTIEILPREKARELAKGVRAGNVANITKIEIIPYAPVLTVGKEQVFKAKGFDKDGKEIGFTPVWSVSGGGKIQADGTFKGHEKGTYYIRVKVPGTDKIERTRIIIID